jgi:hypothetical protein
MKSQFKGIVIALGILYLSFICLPFLWGHIYSEDTLNALAWNGFNSLIDVHGPTPLIISLFLLASLVGLYKFKKWGRHLFATTTLISGILTPLYGVVVGVGIDNLVSYFFAIGSGAVLSMSYFSNFASEFS